MRFRVRHVLPAVAMAAISLFGMSQQAHATLTLTFADGIPADTVVLTDAGHPGQVFIPANTIVGNFVVNGSATAPPAAGQVLPNELISTQNTINVASLGSGTLTVTLADTNLSLPPGVVSMESVIQASQFSGPAGASYQFQSWLDKTNGTTPAGITFGPQGPYTTPIPIVNADVFVGISPAAVFPFSVINMVTFKATAAGQTLSDTGTTNLFNTPEPSTLLSAGFGLIALAFGWRRFKKIA